MSNYETDPAGLGVGKRYGPLNLGGVAGVTANDNGEYRIVAEVSAKELSANDSIDIQIPEGYALLHNAWAEVDVAFGTGDVIDITYDGSTVLDSTLDVSSTGLVEGDFTVIGSTTVVAGKTITLDVSAVDSGDTDGYCKVIVELKRV